MTRLERTMIPAIPGSRLNSMTREETEMLNDPNGLGATFRSCSLAALNAGMRDGITEVIRNHVDYRVQVERNGNGVHITLHHPPECSLKEVRPNRSEVIGTLAAHVRSIALDLLLHRHLFPKDSVRALEPTEGIRKQLEFDGVLDETIANGHPMTRVVYQGGQNISEDREYPYAKSAGTALGMMQCEVITGGGNGTMKAPLRGASKGQRFQNIQDGKMIGLTCPSIIGNELPNMYVNPLVTLPDMEKRLEAFVRMAMGTMIGPGGIGTIEEVLHLLSILLYPDNSEQVFSIVLTGPEPAFFKLLKNFICEAFGDETWKRFERSIRIIIDNPKRAVEELWNGMENPLGVRAHRRAMDMSTVWNDQLVLPKELQQPLEADHESIASIDLTRDQPAWRLIAETRKAASAIVWAQVTPEGNAAVREHGPLTIEGDARVTRALDHLLDVLAAQGRFNFRDGKVKAYRFAQ